MIATDFLPNSETPKFLSKKTWEVPARSKKASRLLTRWCNVSP